MDNKLAASKKNFPLLVVSIYLLWISFSVYSYSQVDLNLTLFSNSVYLVFQQMLTRFGYFNRSLSAIFFAVFVVILIFLYNEVLSRIWEKNLAGKLKSLIIVVYGMALFAYPGFSYDIFNYLFDARIVTKYHLSPYYFKALDFPDDTWTRFMRWTHRYYPYGPLWLVLTIVPSTLGLDKFVVTLFLFKFLFFAAALTNVLLIRKISEIVTPGKENMVTAFFALNPLVIVESIVSPHNEVFVVFFSLWAIYMLFKHRIKSSLLLLFLSVGIKFLTLTLSPLFIVFFLKKKIFTYKRFLLFCLLIYLVTLTPVILLRESYPWYFIPVIALSSFFCMNMVVRYTIIGLSTGLLFRYVPYLWYGDWNAPVPIMNSFGMIALTGLGLIIGIIKSSR